MSRVKDIDIAKRLVRTQQSANKRNLPFDMSFAKMKRILNAKRCFFTNVELTFEDPESENYLTLDRVDASKGYVDDNVVACARAFNLRKGDVTAIDIVQMYKGLKKKNLV